MFHSAEQLIEKTTGFWGFIKNTKLDDECEHYYDYLKSPFPDGPNPYLDMIEHNMAKVNKMVASNQVEDFVDQVFAKL